MKNIISCNSVKKMIDEGEDFLLLDVREIWEYKEQNIKGKNIPLGRLPFRMNEIINHKNSPVIVCCKSGIRSSIATRYLLFQGFTGVKSMEGGITKYLKMK